MTTAAYFLEAEGLMRPGEARVLWSAEAVRTAKRMSAEGRSAGEIAKIMAPEHPGITRNAVIGKLHRLGFAGGGQQPNKDKPIGPRSHRQPRTGAWSFGEKPRPPVSLASVAVSPTLGASRVGQGVRARSEKRGNTWVDRDIPAPESKWITVVDLDGTTCRWPHGDPGDLDTFRYCGAPTLDRYCAHHTALSHSGHGYQQAKANEKTWMQTA